MKIKTIFITLITILTTTVIVFQSCKKDEENNKIPTCTITSPTNGQELTKGETVTISVAAIDSDGNITEVRFFIDNVGKGSATSFPFNYNWNTNDEDIGSHTIKATCIDNNGGSAIDEITIDLAESGGGNTHPTALFTVTPSSGTTSTSFAFDASGSTDNEDPTSNLQIRWDFDGNGSWDTGWDYDKNKNHQYSNENTYTAKLEVKDTEGLTDQYTKSINVSNGGGGNIPPTALFTVSPSSGTTSTNFAFDASGSTDNEDPTSNLQVRWDFDGNGSWDTGWNYGKTENHQYSSENTYTAKLEVKDSEGLTDQYTKSITVSNGGGGNGCGGQSNLTYDGQTYEIVEIGNQCWMAENLNYETTNSWWYDNSSANGDIYGRLYTWDAALTACPSGWSLPSDNEWKQMEMALGMSQSEADDTGYRGTDEGEKMKSTSGWNNNGNGTNSSGFNALPGGYRSSSGSFRNLGNRDFWWSSSESSGTFVWGRYLTYDYDQVNRYYYNNTSGFSVRCLKN